MHLSVLSLSLVNNRNLAQGSSGSYQGIVSGSSGQHWSGLSMVNKHFKFSCSFWPASFSRPDYRDRSLSLAVFTNTSQNSFSTQQNLQGQSSSVFTPRTSLNPRTYETFPRFSKSFRLKIQIRFLVVLKAAIFHPTKFTRT